MDKEELLQKEQNYYDIVVNTIKSNKKNKKQNSGHFLFNKSNNPALIGFSTFALTLVSGFALYGPLGLPAVYSLPIAAGASTVVSYVIPKIIHSIIMHSKGKLALGYAKMELDSMFPVMREYFKKYYLNILNADSAEDISIADLKNFVNQTQIFAENYKNDLNRWVGKKIYNRNKHDYKKIIKIINSSKNEVKSQKKIDKIIRKNEEFVRPWCDLYNKCGKIAQNLFTKTNQMNPNIEIPDDYEFYADHNYLLKMVANKLNENAPAHEVEKTITFETANDSLNKKTNKTQNPKYEKLKKYFDEKIRRKEDEMER